MRSRVPMIIDFHVHAFPLPGKMENLFPRVAQGPLAQARRKTRDWMKPWSDSLHHVQPILRHLPIPARERFESLMMLIPVAGLLLESTPFDLLEALRRTHVDHAILIAHPPHTTNEFVLDMAEQHPEILAAVNIASGTAKPALMLKKYLKQGARALKIHAAADGEGPDSPRYHALLKVADEAGLPVIIHTGCFHWHLFFKDPDQGRAERFAPWFEKYKSAKFVMAHMNLHEPQVALDLAEEHENVFVDTSWQPSEVIAEAARRVGPQRVLFGSDWPMVGGNIAVGLKRIDRCVKNGLISAQDAELIRGKNAAQLLGLSS